MTLTRQSGYQFVPLIAIVVFLVSGMTPFRAVFLATLLAIVLSFVRRETALRPARLITALETGGRAVLAVAATTATAGIIVGVVTLTGLGLKISSIIVDLAGGNLFFTVVYAAVAVWMLGLAVPVTASYIIAAVMIAPALTLVGVPDVAAHMFIFYYAVLSEVSPPTALSPFAAAAITGGNPFKTMMLTWKYTLPAFLVPFAFTLSPEGLGSCCRPRWPTSPAPSSPRRWASSPSPWASAAGCGRRPPRPSAPSPSPAACCSSTPPPPPTSSAPRASSPPSPSTWSAPAPDLVRGRVVVSATTTCPGLRRRPRRRTRAGRTPLPCRSFGDDDRRRVSTVEHRWRVVRSATTIDVELPTPPPVLR